MKKVGVIVGHHGPGTGCSWDGRDEWSLAFDDATEIFKAFLIDGHVMPKLFHAQSFP